MSHSLSHPFSVDFGGMSSSPGLLAFTSRLQSSSLLSSTVLSFLPLPFLLAVPSVIMSLKSGYIFQLPSTYLWPRLLSADFHPGTHFSLGHLIDTEARLLSLSLTPVTAASLSFLYSVDGKYTLLSHFLISLHQEVLVSLAWNYNRNLTTSHSAYCCPPQQLSESSKCQSCPSLVALFLSCPCGLQQCGQSCAQSDVTSLLCSGLCKSQSPYLNHCLCEFSLRFLLFLYPSLTVGALLVLWYTMCAPHLGIPLRHSCSVYHSYDSHLNNWIIWLELQPDYSLSLYSIFYMHSIFFYSIDPLQ